MSAVGSDIPASSARAPAARPPEIARGREQLQAAREAHSFLDGLLDEGDESSSDDRKDTSGETSEETREGKKQPKQAKQAKKKMKQGTLFAYFGTPKKKLKKKAKRKEERQSLKSEN